jgi:hypothetical protein
MSMLQRLAHDLRNLEPDLREHPDVAARLHEVVRLLESDAVRWIDAGEARQLIGALSERTIEVWARRELVRSRRLPDGRLQVSLDDLLERKAIMAALAGPFDDGPLSPEELESLRKARIASLPRRRDEIPGGE